MLHINRPSLSDEVAHLTSTISMMISSFEETQLADTISSHQQQPVAAISGRLPSFMFHSAYSKLGLDEENPADFPPNRREELADTSIRSSIPETGVIVESNFKVYAYTANTLLLAVLCKCNAFESIGGGWRIWTPYIECCFYFM